MALAGIALNIYGKAEDFFRTIQNGQAPEKFTQQHLKDLGFTSTNYRAFIPLLKALGFLTDDGVPTQRYHDYRNNALSRKVMGKAIKEAYSDIFVIKEFPKPEDEELIQGKFKSTFNTSDANSKKMTKTFYALLDIADINSDEDEVALNINEENNSQNNKVENNNDIKDDKPMKKLINYPSLNYNIQVHLPATKDVEVYNAIFKSLKEHLID